MKHLSRKAAAFILTALVVVATVALSGCTVNISTGSGKQLETATTIDTYSLDEFDSIEADLDIADISFASGSDYLVTVDRENYPELEVSVSNGKLVIAEPEGSWNAVASSCAVTIKVPVSARLDTADLEADTGDIAVDDIACATLKASTDTGDISVVACGVDSYDVSTDVGSIDLLGIGDVSSASIDARTDVGSINVAGQTTTGTFTQSGSGIKIKAETDTGSITIN